MIRVINVLNIYDDANSLIIFHEKSTNIFIWKHFFMVHQMLEQVKQNYTKSSMMVITFIINKNVPQLLLYYLTIHYTSLKEFIEAGRLW